MNLSLYLVATRGNLTDIAFLKRVKAAIKGGVSVVQLREKSLNSREFFKLALKLKTLCDECKIPLIINDRLDVALAVNATGVHLGQDDIPVSVAKRLLGEDKIIGLSVKNLTQLENIEGADYLGVGAVFPTQTKDSSVIGVQNLAQIAKNSPLPVVAIGGINESNAKMLTNTEISGIALSSALMKSENPFETARNLSEISHEILRTKNA